MTDYKFLKLETSTKPKKKFDAVFENRKNGLY